MCTNTLDSNIPKKEIDLAKQENEYRPKGEGKRPC
jgi:hypothetical protein